MKTKLETLLPTAEEKVLGYWYSSKERSRITEAKKHLMEAELEVYEARRSWKGLLYDSPILNVKPICVAAIVQRIRFRLTQAKKHVRKAQKNYIRAMVPARLEVHRAHKRISSRVEKRMYEDTIPVLKEISYDRL